jgi:putative hydrolase of the HAD superfamily
MNKVRLPDAGDAFVYWQSYLQKWGLNLSREQFFDFWFHAEKEIPEMIALAKNIRDKGIKILILSNNFIERVDYYEQNFNFLKEVIDRVYYSWQTGFIKPDIRAYQKILSDYNLKPEECLYFDDSKGNIEVANQLGIKSFIFKDVDATKKILKDCGVL